MSPFENHLDFMEINILTKFHEDWIKKTLCYLEHAHGFSKI